MLAVIAELCAEIRVLLELEPREEELTDYPTVQIDGQVEVPVVTSHDPVRDARRESSMVFLGSALPFLHLGYEELFRVEHIVDEVQVLPRRRNGLAVHP